MRAQLVEALEMVRRECLLPDHVASVVGAALEQFGDSPGLVRRIYSHDLRHGEACVYGEARAAAVIDIVRERERQEGKCATKRAEGMEWLTCADTRMDDGEKLAVLMEEVGEVAHELTEALAGAVGPDVTVPRLRAELVQVAAVALEWVESSYEPVDPAFVVIGVEERS
jgi:hypothetical protein